MATASGRKKRRRLELPRPGAENVEDVIGWLDKPSVHL